ncbi:acyl dehydratase [Allopusillimonas soli]|uniref:Acyl dehydratase n=2 Tax=Allopusillimonas soli TaxID=659016 RepID=A0A853F743_9BURK|nr:acyl dehydratase [Allopusillimonas soli]TEA76764.1 acyl dehydratase [Allopusillimonas soli]
MVFYYEDMQEGMLLMSPARTVTEADIVNFAGVSGDFNALHMDAEYAQGHPFGRRAAHGLLVLAITSGLCSRMLFSQLTASSRLALAGLDCQWLKPVFIGDTIRVQMSVHSRTPSATRVGTGVVCFLRRVFNQDGTEVLRSTWNVLMKMR